MNKHDKIFIAGSRGMVGGAIMRRLIQRGYANLLIPTHEQLELRDHDAVSDYFTEEEPQIVFLAAAQVGGIQANIDDPWGFLLNNLRIQTAVMHAALTMRVERLVFLSSSCTYPRECPQPMKEEYILTGPFEPTNEGYAIAKVAGMKLAEAVRKQYKLPWITAIPCNLYGPGDNFDPEKSHVISGLVRKFVLAKNAGKTAVLWGTGRPRREILHVEDAAEACILAAEKFDGTTINVGCGREYSILELAQTVASVIGYKGEIEWDASRPDGMPRKCMDVSRLTALGFEPRVSLEEGIKRMVGDFNKLLAR